MMQIPCPWCGMRDEPEFVYGGTTHIVRPGLEATDQQWGDYLFFATIRGVDISSDGVTPMAAVSGSTSPVTL